MPANNVNLRSTAMAIKQRGNLATFIAGVCFFATQTVNILSRSLLLLQIWKVENAFSLDSIILLMIETEE
jgi:hypothetical protein